MGRHSVKADDPIHLTDMWIIKTDRGGTFYVEAGSKHVYADIADRNATYILKHPYNPHCEVHLTTKPDWSTANMLGPGGPQYWVPTVLSNTNLQPLKVFKNVTRISTDSAEFGGVSQENHGSDGDW